MLKLNLGAGRANLEGYTPIDIKRGENVFPLPESIEADSVDAIRASHILEHFPDMLVQEVVNHWVSKLKPGGVIEISVPDIDKAVLMKDNPDWHRYIIGGQIDEHDFHESIWDRNRLRNVLHCAGLLEVGDWDGDKRDTSSNPVSLNLKGRKPMLEKFEAGFKPLPQEPMPEQVPNERKEKRFKDIKIAAVTSIPRLGWQDHFGCMFNAFRPFGIPLHTSNSVFWAESMQGLLEKCITMEVDWILTLDYDTLFTEFHIDKMFGILGRNEKIDALVPIQRKRNSPEALAVMKKDGVAQGRVHLDGKAVQCDSAHFGLSLLRVDALRKVPKPWFFSLPTNAGTWRNDNKADAEGPFKPIREALGYGDVPGHLRIDADIWFWKQWQKAGNTLYLAPTVSVGHLELYSSGFDPDGKPVTLSVFDWFERNKPGYKTREV